MHVTAVRTPVVRANEDLFAILDEALPKLEERSVVVVSSKIVALCEGRVVPLDEEEKSRIVEQEAQWFIPASSSKYGVTLTITRDQMFANAGVDESNAENQFVLWPKDPQESANGLWEFLRQRDGLKEVGVIISDSRLLPLVWGVLGAGIAHAGFKALSSKIGKPDIFGRPLKMTQVNVVQGVAVAAVFEMGESNEQTPLAVVTEIRDIEFQNRPPSQEELEGLKIDREDDMYASILMAAPWQKGGGGYERSH